MFIWLSNFEKYRLVDTYLPFVKTIYYIRYLSQEYASRMIKVFISHFINTGIIIVLINVHFDDSQLEVI